MSVEFPALCSRGPCGALHRRAGLGLHDAPGSARLSRVLPRTAPVVLCSPLSLGEAAVPVWSWRHHDAAGPPRVSGQLREQSGEAQPCTSGSQTRWEAVLGTACVRPAACPPRAREPRSRRYCPRVSGLCGCGAAAGPWRSRPSGQELPGCPGLRRPRTGLRSATELVGEVASLAKALCAWGGVVGQEAGQLARTCRAPSPHQRLAGCWESTRKPDRPGRPVVGPGPHQSPRTANQGSRQGACPGAAEKPSAGHQN